MEQNYLAKMLSESCRRSVFAIVMMASILSALVGCTHSTNAVFKSQINPNMVTFKTALQFRPAFRFDIIFNRRTAAEVENVLESFVDNFRNRMNEFGVRSEDERTTKGVITFEVTVEDESRPLFVSLTVAGMKSVSGLGSSTELVTWKGRLHAEMGVFDRLSAADYARVLKRFEVLTKQMDTAAKEAQQKVETISHSS